jgi:hypothetical protein
MDDKIKILVESYAQAHRCDLLSAYLALKEKPDKVAVGWVVDAKVRHHGGPSREQLFPGATSGARQ